MSIRKGGGSRLAGGGGGAPGGETFVSPGSRQTTNSTVQGVVRRTSRASCNKMHNKEIKNLLEAGRCPRLYTFVDDERRNQSYVVVVQVTFATVTNYLN